MKNNNLIFLSIILFSLPISSEWVKLAKTEDYVDYYVDSESIVTKGENTFFWSLADYPTPIEGLYYSAIQYVELDCSILRYRVLDVVFYEEKMAEGDSRSPEIPANYKEWQYTVPGSAYKIVLSAVCS